MIRKRIRFEERKKRQDTIDKVGEILEDQVADMVKEIAKVLAETIDKDSEAGQVIAQHANEDGTFDINASGQYTTITSSANDPTYYEVFTNQSVSLKGSDTELFPFSLKVNLFPYADDFHYFVNQIDRINDLFERLESEIIEKNEVEDVGELSGSEDYEVFRKLKDRFGFSLHLYDKILEIDEQYYEDDPEYQKYLEDVDNEMALMDDIEAELRLLLKIDVIV